MLPAAAWRDRLESSSRLLNFKLRGADCKETQVFIGNEQNGKGLSVVDVRT